MIKAPVPSVMPLGSRQLAVAAAAVRGPAQVAGGHALRRVTVASHTFAVCFGSLCAPVNAGGTFAGNAISRCHLADVVSPGIENEARSISITFRDEVAPSTLVKLYSSRFTVQQLLRRRRHARRPPPAHERATTNYSINT
ncbi:hypothetical protein EVAR_97292_1 [Eumeta japonica]|uniref:Uncharacterized protein n=1 Tax=Eumeta variegata TaxID=151549 RepID=A0A4C1XFH9_EUMVA|nr:hypothetical protein EVAR_97292_1 [Eumeta japonica]